MSAIEQTRVSTLHSSDPTWLAPPLDRTPRPRLPAAPLTIEIIQDRPGFDALKPDWDRLHRKASRTRRLAFQSHAWLSEWCNAYLEDTPSAPVRLAIAVVRRGATACLICPFATEREFGLTTLVWMGDPASQYGDVLLDPELASTTELAAAFHRLLDHVAPDIVNLRRVRADAAIAPFLRAENAAVVCANRAPYMDFSTATSPDAYALKFSAKTRKNRRRLRRRLEEKGEVRTDVLAPGPAAADAMRLGLAFKRQWLVRRGEICSALRDHKLQSLLERAVTSRDAGFEPFVSVMTCAGEPISVQFGLITANRLALHMIAYDPAWEKVAPGILHTEATVAHCIENGIDELDFLGPDADYKRAWSDAAAPLDDYILTPTWSGRLYSETCLGHSRERFKSMLDHLPLAVRSLIARTIEHRATATGPRPMP